MKLKHKIMSLPKPFLIATVVIVVLVVAYGAIDLTARLWLRHYYAAIDQFVFLNTRPAPYQHSPYFSSEFLAEQKQFWQYIPRAVDDMTNLTFHSEYYNIDQGIRTTTNSPSSWINTIYLFGSSTMLGPHVPDSYTISSYLQRLTPKYRVVVIGLAAATSDTLVSVLETVHLQPGDIVVFYTGWADSETPYTVLIKRYRATLPCQQYLQIRVVELLCLQEPDLSPADEQLYIETERVPAVNIYIQAINSAKTYSEHHGSKFYNVIEPAIWSKPLSTYEGQRLAVVSSNLKEYVWHSIEPYIATADPEAINMVHALDEIRNQGVEVYFDDAHVNEYANEIVARKLYDALFPVF